jgi:DNA-damage-inducible protein D
MKKEFISELFKKFEDACYDYDGVECWSARELQNILGYSQWKILRMLLKKLKSLVNKQEKK